MSGAGGDWLGTFAALARLEPAALKLLQDSVVRADLPRGAVLFEPGALCRNYLMVLDGSARVQMVAENGREIILYRVARGGTCVLTTSCLMTEAPYNAEGVAETEVSALALPSGPFHQLLAQSDVFRRFVFTSFGTRITSLLTLLEEVAFGRVDLRLARFLLEHRDARSELPMTHQALAVELGTAREVVSRQLKEFERQGFVTLNRGCIAVANADELARLCD
ncbi:Crp/Fnr family transcriptional regulator [Azospirillum sp.]|uniref:Crp/Fnr family transcriptional regulator n=1 Tax=Azospirillum sp. TaxID=34012 RepID=UPI002D4D3F1F|nr:Crp/Fnr family transcriptional regulator [Azospirillum sp.]HYD67184.1 Crp/Fnr family transcriptional regulator [Azospirillum sp.]